MKDNIYKKGTKDIFPNVPLSDKQWYMIFLFFLRGNVKQEYISDSSESGVCNHTDFSKWKKSLVTP